MIKSYVRTTQERKKEPTRAVRLPLSIPQLSPYPIRHQIFALQLSLKPNQTTRLEVSVLSNSQHCKETMKPRNIGDKLHNHGAYPLAAHCSSCIDDAMPRPVIDGQLVDKYNVKLHC